MQLSVAPRSSRPLSSPPVHRAISDFSLPDARTLFERSIRELENVLIEYHQHLCLLNSQLLEGNRLSDGAMVDHCRQELQETNSEFTRQLLMVEGRLAARNRVDGQFGSLVRKLCTAIDVELKRVRGHHQQLGELAAETVSRRVSDELLSRISLLRSHHDRMMQIVHDVQQELRLPKRVVAPCTDEALLRSQLGTILAQWWEAGIEIPGPMTIALLTVDHIARDFADVAKSSASALLASFGNLILGSQFRRIGIETPVVDVRMQPRLIAWSCAVVEDADGNIASIIAAGQARNGPSISKTVKDGSASPEPRHASESARLLPPTERRFKKRIPFPHVQLVAPVEGTALPPISAFSEMRCHDISEDGISFFSETMPSSASVVVALGTRPPHIYMLARVAHFARREEEAAMNYIVGCEFTGRAMLLAEHCKS